MKRAYKFRFYPTPEQAELLARTFGCVRFVYNSILRWRIDAYNERKEKMGYVQASARLTALKKSLNLPGSMTFPACRYSSRCATNRPPLLTFSPGVPHTRHSK
jgi:transposase